MNKFFIILVMSFAVLGASKIDVSTPIYKFNTYKYETPQGRKMRISKHTQLLIVAFGKKTGALVNAFLDTKDPYYLLKKRAVFIADINKMPDIITKMFALPKLQKYKHLIYLTYNENFKEAVPNKDGKITILEIEDFKIKNIAYIATTKELIKSIEK